VTNSGELDGTTVYLFGGLKIFETRDGSGNNMVQQFIAPLTRRGSFRGRAAGSPLRLAHHAVSRANHTRSIDGRIQLRTRHASGGIQPDAAFKGDLYVHEGERS
jgi:hypothetical protein